MENSERLDQQVRSRIESGTSRLSDLSADPLHHWLGPYKMERIWSILDYPVCHVIHQKVIFNLNLLKSYMNLP